MPRLAMLSCWNHYHARSFARDLAELPEAEIVALWDEEAPRGAAFAREFATEFEPDLEALLARPDIDGVILDCAPEHAAGLISSAAEAGKHVLADQVLALTTKDALTVAETIERAGIAFAIDMSLKRWPINLAAKRLVEAGTIGGITSVRIRNAHDGALGDGWPYRFRESAHGVFADLGAHCLYLARWLLGRPAAVTAIVSRYSGGGIAEDNAACILEYANGAIALCDASHVACRSPFSVELYGTRGSYLAGGATGEHRKLLKPGDGTFRLLTDEGSGASPLPKEAGTPSIRQWLKAMQGEAVPLFGVNEGIDLAQMLEALYLSARTGQKVYFDRLES